MTTTWTYHYGQIDIHQNPVDYEEERQRQEEEDDRIYWVPDHGFAWLDSKIARLNKIANKLELPEVGYRVIQEELRDDPKDELKQRKILWKQIEMLGEAPKLKGYSFIARILHSTEGNILKSVPGEELPQKYRTAEPLCQHCNLKRRRNDTFVLKKDETGELIQVGSNCLSDFLGHRSPDSYARFADSMSDLAIELKEMDEEGWGGGGGYGGYEITSFLRIIYAYVKSYGWLGRGAARERGSTASVDHAISLIHAKDQKSKDMYQNMMSKLTAEDDQMLEDALTWARGLKEGNDEEVDKLSDYYWNLTVACASPIVVNKTEGIVASLPIAYDKAVLKKIQPTVTTVVGNKGQEVVLQGVVESEEVARDSNVYEVRTNDNKLIRWYGEPIMSNVGDIIFLKGVVVSYSKKFTATVTQLAQVQILDEAGYLDESQKAQKEQHALDIPEYTEGQKFTTNVTVLKKRDMDSMYGTTTMFVMVDDAGTNLVYFSTSFQLEIGEKANITATVKEVGEFNNQPSIKITRAKINSREIPEGTEDTRLNKAEEKELKSQSRKIKKAIKVITERTGFEQDNDLYTAINEIDRVLMPAFRWARDSLNGLTEKEGIRHFVAHPEKIEAAVERCLMSGQQSNEERKVELQQRIYTNQKRLSEEQAKLSEFPEETPEFNQIFQQQKAEVRRAQNDLNYTLNYGDRTIKEYETEVAEFMQVKDQKVQEAIQIAQGLQSRMLDWENSKEELEGLRKQLNEIEERLWRHKQDIKQYGPRKDMLMARGNWLQKVAF